MARPEASWVRIALFALLAACSVICFGCEDDPEGNRPIVHLDRLEKLEARDAASPDIPFRVAVAAIISPEGTVESYRPLLNYLGKRLNRPARLIQRRTYWEVNEMIARNEVDLAFICTGAYLQEKGRHIMSILVVPEIDGKVTYNAVIIVAAKSRIRGFDDLEGKVFAFTDPLSNTGYLYPMHLLARRCTTPEEFFRRTIFTYSHDRSIQAVVEGVADGASVDNIVFQNALKKEPSLAKRVRVILKSEAFGMPPVVVPERISSVKRKRLEEIFLHMHEDPEGRAALRHLGVDRFVRPSMKLYNSPCLDDTQRPCLQ